LSETTLYFAQLHKFKRRIAVTILIFHKHEGFYESIKHLMKL